MAKKKAAGKSVIEEMACEIARIAQTRVVEVDRVSFACGPVTLKMVKTTTGLGWLLDDHVMFCFDQHDVVARALLYNIMSNAPRDEFNYWNLRFVMTGTIVWRCHFSENENCAYVAKSQLAALLKRPPLLID